MTVEVVTTEPGWLAAVRRHVGMPELPPAIPAALDVVWAFVREAGLTTNHNVLVYDGDLTAEAGTEVWFGVQVAEPFEPPADSEVACLELPAVRAGHAVHRGPYDQVGVTHTAVRDHLAAEDLARTGRSWDVYGDWSDDPDELMTDVYHQVAG